MNKKNYIIVSAILFGLVALLHLLRTLMGWEVFIGTHSLPVSRSWIVFGITVCLAAWAFRGSKGYAVVTAILFGLVGLLHLYRALITGTVISIDEWVVPVSASWVGFVVSAALSAWGFHSYRS